MILLQGNQPVEQLLDWKLIIMYMIVRLSCWYTWWNPSIALHSLFIDICLRKLFASRCKFCRISKRNNYESWWSKQTWFKFVKRLQSDFDRWLTESRLFIYIVLHMQCIVCFFLEIVTLPARKDDSDLYKKGSLS